MSTKIINLIVLITCCTVLVLAPFKKYIWYDESVSVEAVNGITYNTPSHFPVAQISGSTIDALNTTGNVSIATVYDNNNSLLYNLGLHGFLQLTGRSLNHYLLFSRLCAVLALLALYLLATLILGETIYVSAAILFLATDLTFIGMANEIRTYSLGIFAVIMAANHAFRLLGKKRNVWHLVAFCLWGLAALLSHFFTLYALGILFVFILVSEEGWKWVLRHAFVLALPLVVLGGLFFASKHAITDNNFHTMVVDHADAKDYSIGGVFVNFMKYAAINYRIIFPKMTTNIIVSILSFLLLAAIIFTGWNSINRKNDKPTFVQLLILGIISCVFLSLLCFKLHTYAPFYFRYFSFSLPFIALFLAYVVRILQQRYERAVLSISVFLLLLLPAGAINLMFLMKTTAKKNYNHSDIAGIIAKDHLKTLGVPSIKHALMVQCFLPFGTDIQYTIDTTSPDFVLFNGASSTHVPAIMNEK